MTHDNHVSYIHAPLHDVHNGLLMGLCAVEQLHKEMWSDEGGKKEKVTAIMAIVCDLHGRAVLLRQIKKTPDHHVSCRDVAR